VTARAERHRGHEVTLMPTVGAVADRDDLAAELVPSTVPTGIRS
jgi:hypothetical protein